MVPAARKRMIDPTVLLVACALAMMALTLFVVYQLAIGADKFDRQRANERNACEMSHVMRGDSLVAAELACR